MVPLIFAAAEPVAAAAATNSTTDESGKDVIEDLRHMTSFIVPFTIVAFVFLLSQRFLKGAMPSMVLSGLLYVTLQSQSGQLQQAASSKKQEKKLQQLMKSAKPSSTSVVWSMVSPGLLDRLEMTEDFDLLLLGCVVFTASAAFAVIMKMLVHPVVGTYYLSFTLTGFVFVASLIGKVEWSHLAIGKADKLYMLIVAICAACFSFWLLMYAPRSLHAFNAQGASAELGGRLTVLQTRVKNLLAMLDLPMLEGGEVPAVVVAAPLALCGGVLSALLMAPGLRYGKVLQVLLKPPLWAHNFAGRPSLMRLLVQAGFMAQVMMLALWVPPLMDALFISPDVVRYLRGVGMLVVLALQFLALPQLVQAHLFIAAYKADIIQNMTVLDATARRDLLRRQLSRTLAELCKVAMQLAFLPSLLLLCGCLHMLMAFPSPLAATDPKVSIWDKQPSVLYQTLSGFLGWWATGSFVCWAVIGVVLSRAQGATD